MSHPEFVVYVRPRVINAAWPDARTVYDIKVHDAVNDNLLVFSNQGYENRRDAVDLALKLFSGKRALLQVIGADGQFVSDIDLSVLSV